MAMQARLNTTLQDGILKSYEGENENFTVSSSEIFKIFVSHFSPQVKFIEIGQHSTICKMRFFIFLVLTNFIAPTYSQLVHNGDVRVYSKYKRAINVESALRRRIKNLATAYAEMADSEYARYKRRMANLAHAERGSMFYPDGRAIPGNENLDTQV